MATGSNQRKRHELNVSEQAFCLIHEKISKGKIPYRRLTDGERPPRFARLAVFVTSECALHRRLLFLRQ